jgi:NADPH-dependent 2,4-dienoyl-CoA reductase/sulfur reductase-like enzyme
MCVPLAYSSPIIFLECLHSPATVGTRACMVCDDCVTMANHLQYNSRYYVSPLPTLLLSIESLHPLMPESATLSTTPRAVVAGAGPVGCLAAIALAKQGWTVDIYEGRPGARASRP